MVRRFIDIYQKGFNQRFKDILEKGNNQLIKNLVVVQDDYKFKTTKHKIKLNFISSTKCKKG